MFSDIKRVKIMAYINREEIYAAEPDSRVPRRVLEG